MTQVRDVLGRARPLAVAAVFVAASFIPLVSIASASAGVLANRSLLITSSREGDLPSTEDPGHPDNGTEVGHTYTFTPRTAGTIEGLSFEVCNTAFGYLEDNSCTGIPAGFDVTAAFTGVTVNTTTGWTFARISANEWTISKDASAIAVDGIDDVVTVVFPASASAYFTNPDAQGTFFSHIATYGDSTAVDYDANFNNTTNDEGTVTSAIVTSIDINTRVQETLKFSVEGDQRDVDDIPANANDNSSGNAYAGSGTFNGARLTTADVGVACSPLTGSGQISMGNFADNALASDTTYDAMSYFRMATNSASGARVYYAGETLRSSSELIDPIGATATLAAPGSEQFGLAFDDGQASHLLTDLTPEAAYANGRDFALAPDFEFAFVASSAAPNLLAASTGVVECDTGAVRYIANIADETAAGIYTTRIVYIAAPSY